MTDGISKETCYIVLTFLLLLVPVFNMLSIMRSRANKSWLDFHLKKKALEEHMKTNDLSSKIPVMNILAIICNIVLLGVSCWAIVNQYPHPKESGLLLYTVILILTPILSSVALAFSKK
jgi:UDP-N-acetylmuramyl pentapeptide phosphotransferase/UDP-N-acetylglucosamine-1-phosphate transferase